nr:MAG: coat protein [Leviviridae sp.]
MQANQISLNVDPANDSTIVPETYDRYQEFENRSVYIGSTHVPEARDMIAFYRTFPTKSGNFKGVSKSAVKITEDVEVAGVDSATTLTAPVIIEISFSVPVGTPTAELVNARQRAIALLDDDTLMNSVNVQLMV